eukprot:TRINITY_DN17991_c0_g1_i1.p2 TRINITY_DN17991_c0_g1~~TRINITY_DN17991_c0_g1_i1.p2  ORF type:complete len:245 (+),score=66.75 TRINITY_DN17991_c0_g1_i1:118-852(+)
MYALLVANDPLGRAPWASSAAAVDTRDVDGRTPLWHACEGGLLAVVRTLLRRGASADAADAEGTTPLMAACWHGHAEAVAALLAHGASAGARRSADGWTAAHHACGCVGWASDGAGPLRLLLQRGNADPDARNAQGETPLHVAALFGRSAHVRALLAAGADTRLRNGAGQRAVDDARQLQRLVPSDAAVARVVSLLAAEESFLVFAGCLHRRLGVRAAAASTLPRFLLHEIRRHLWDDCCPLMP